MYVNGEVINKIQINLEVLLNMYYLFVIITHTHVCVCICIWITYNGTYNFILWGTTKFVDVRKGPSHPKGWKLVV